MKKQKKEARKYGGNGIIPGKISTEERKPFGNTYEIEEEDDETFEVRETSMTFKHEKQNFIIIRVFEE